MNYTQPKSNIVNFYYGNAKLLDLSKMRAEAVTVSKGDEKHVPKLAIIHFHRFGEHCKGQDHETYKDGQKEESK